MICAERSHHSDLFNFPSTNIFILKKSNTNFYTKAMAFHNSMPLVIALFAKRTLITPFPYVETTWCILKRPMLVTVEDSSLHRSILQRFDLGDHCLIVMYVRVFSRYAGVSRFLDLCLEVLQVELAKAFLRT